MLSKLSNSTACENEKMQVTKQTAEEMRDRGSQKGSSAVR